VISEVGNCASSFVERKPRGTAKRFVAAPKLAPLLDFVRRYVSCCGASVDGCKCESQTGEPNLSWCLLKELYLCLSSMSGSYRWIAARAKSEVPDAPIRHL